ncbi:MAG: hypothetical protein ACI8QD_002632 [Cyclobacteriaceae bacterium]
MVGLIAYRVNSGPLLSVHELQVIAGFDPSTIKKIMPFVTCSKTLSSLKSELTNQSQQTDNYLIVRHTRTIQSKAGYQNDDGYLGSPDHVYARWRLSDPDNFSLGFTTEKDAGEAIKWNDQVKGFDYWSFHAQIKNMGAISNLVIGDYQLQFGQGLVFGAGFAPGKGAETILTTRRGNTGLRPFASVIESGFFRGVATTVELRDLDVTLFYSNLNQDGNRQLDTTYSADEEFFNSIQVTGMHRTAKELAAKNQINENSFGANILFQKHPRFNLGLTLLSNQFDRPIIKKPTTYNRYEFTGKQNMVGSAYINYTWQNVLLFGEYARSKSNGQAVIAGLIATITPSIDLSMVSRNYAEDYHSFYGQAFGETSRVINEKGVYWGISVKPSRTHQFHAYYDRFFFPWIKFQVEAPSDGFEWLARYTFAPTKKMSLFLQHRLEHKQVTETPSDQNLQILIDRIRRQSIVNYQLQVTSRLAMKTRVQFSSLNLGYERSQGLLLLQDVNLRLRKWSINARFALFDTDDFNNRQYVFERNVLYAFALPAYYGQGTRQMLMAVFKPSNKLNIWLRIARFKYLHQDAIGSGFEKSIGNIRSEITSQIRFRF